MHPLFADMRRLPWYAAAWLLAGVVLAAMLVLDDAATWGRALWFALPVTLVYGFVALSSYYVCRSMPYARRRWPIAIAAFAGASLLSGIAWVMLCEAWNGAGGLVTERGNFITMTPVTGAVLLATGFGFYLLSIFAHDVLIAFESVREAARREAESRVLARDAELQMLRTQINPHFLFNSLNSISALTGFDPKAAREMTITLAQFFRATLSLSEQEKIALADELALCEHFLAIEKSRFGRKLEAAFEIDAEARDCCLPPMLLQPLLENAIKHGIRTVDEGGTIAVRAVARDGWLHVSVENPVGDEVETHPERDGTRLGLRNIRQRLAVLYGERARIVWKREDARFAVEIALPEERHAPQTITE